MNKCDRCGLSVGIILDNGTGSKCHPEPIHCISYLKMEIEKRNKIHETECKEL